jgi:hypothetical protein
MLSRHFARWLTDLAWQTDKGVVLATSQVQQVCKERIILHLSLSSSASALRQSTAQIESSSTRSPSVSMAIIVGSLITFYPSVLTPTPLSSLGYDSRLVRQTPGICLSTLIVSKPSRRWISRKVDGTKLTRIGC